MKTILIVVLVLGVLTGFFAWYASFSFKLKPRTDFNLDPAEFSAVISQLRHDVQELAGTIGTRNTIHDKALARAVSYLQKRFEEIGYPPSLQTFQAEGKAVSNIFTVKDSAVKDSKVFVVGAHYDTVFSTPGADDNTSGVAVLLALMKALCTRDLNLTIHFVCFVNEEPPFFKTDEMGAFQYAQMLAKKNLPVSGMISIESVGYFDSKKGSQHYPLPAMSLLYPDSGDFLAVVGNPNSRTLVTRLTRAYNTSSPIPVEGAVLPGFIPGVDWSDHWGFWQHGYPAAMVTDTAIFRNPNYHRSGDLPETLDYEKMYHVYLGLEEFLSKL